MHSMAQACAIIVNKQGDYRIRNWFALCWAMHTKIRLVFALYCQSCDYSVNETYLDMIELYSKDREARLTKEPTKYNGLQTGILLKNLARWNGANVSPVVDGPEEGEDADMDSGDSRVNSSENEINAILDQGIKEIHWAVETYRKGFEELENDPHARELPAYLVSAYQEVSATYAGSCTAISRKSNNGYVDFQKRRWTAEKKMGSVETPELGLLPPYTEDNFGFPLYDPCVETGLEECTCNVRNINWDAAFAGTLGFKPPSSSVLK